MTTDASSWYRAADLYPQAVIQAEQESLDDALQVAHELSSGPLSQKQLDALDHPYAKRHPEPTQDAAIINKQSESGFGTHWDISPPVFSGGEVSSRLTNDSDVAEYLANGTKTMVSRPIIERIEQTIEPRRAERLDQAFRSVLPGGSKNP